ncbi:MAG: DASH family cryptochrome, partial [Cyanobacteria bacterium]|nr:DASH family cryptochrome [Cyanobacteriota bacterium]MDW8202879.1 DASH family cryptochrome [Cyanobacteriota bacterium SKYGB_h_bin112]
MTVQRILLWYRNDLRSHDHEPLHTALASGAQVIPVYCFDPRQFGTTSFGFPKTGGYRAQFLLESVAALRATLRQLGSDLVIRCGRPEAEIPRLCQQVGASVVYCHAEVTSEELAVETALEQALGSISVKFRTMWGHTLYHPDDLPMPIHQLPDVFTQFRKRVEQEATVRPALPSPSQMPALPTTITVGELPTLADLGVEPTTLDDRAVMHFHGGEPAGLQRVQDYIWNRDRLRIYKDTRNGLLGADYSSKFSPWLALGCLSPRFIYQQVQAYEAKRVKNDSTYWLVFELLWRDYFRFVCARYGNRVFRASGLRGIPIPWRQDWQQFDLWREGNTGFPLVDANMRELAATGFMSNRGRQNVASFLTKNLGIDWRMGAEWFESLLIDY